MLQFFSIIFDGLGSVIWHMFVVSQYFKGQFYNLSNEQQFETGTFCQRDHPFMMLAFLMGEGVKNWPNLLMDSSKKLPTGS